MIDAPDKPLPEDSGSTEGQAAGTPAQLEGEVVPRPLAKITGKVSRDIAGLAEFNPEILGQAGAVYLSASYVGELRGERDQLALQLEVGRETNAVLVREQGDLRARVAQLQQALRDERATRGPRATVIFFGSLLLTLGIERVSQGQLVMGAIIGIAGGAVAIAGLRWGRMSVDSE